MRYSLIALLLLLFLNSCYNPERKCTDFKNGTFEHDELLEAVRQFKQNFGTEVNVLHVETPETTEDMKNIIRREKYGN